jgi:hypothetical protein
MNLNPRSAGGEGRTCQRLTPPAGSRLAYFFAALFLLAYGFAWGVSYAKAEALAAQRSEAE